MEIKRILSFLEEVRSEAGCRTKPPLRKSAVAAIVQNPFAGRYVEDLSSLVAASEAIGREISGPRGEAACSRRASKLRQGRHYRACGRAGAR